MHLDLHVACGWFSSMDLEYLWHWPCANYCTLLLPPGPPSAVSSSGQLRVSSIHGCHGCKCIARHLLPACLPAMPQKSVRICRLLCFVYHWQGHLYGSSPFRFFWLIVFRRTENQNTAVSAIIIMALLTPLLSGKRFAGGGRRWICRDTRYKIQRYTDTKIHRDLISNAKRSRAIRRLRVRG